MRHPLALLLSLCILMPSVASAAKPANYWPPNLSAIDIGTLLQTDHIPDPTKNLIAVTADQSATYVAFFFRDAQRQYHLYINDKLIQSGVQTTPAVPSTFFFTSDAHLVAVINPTELTVDGKTISSKGNQFNYFVGANAVVENGGRLYFPETHSIQTEDLKNGQTTTLYDHPEGTILYLRSHGDDLFYAVLVQGNAYLYMNGKRLFATPIDNPTNFAIDDTGDVFFFAKSGNSYTLYKNSFPLVQGPGQGGFVFVSPTSDVWHVSFIPDATSPRISFFQNKQKLPLSLGNMEGFMAFDGDHYATRASKAATPNLFSLLKDGAFLGKPFDFSKNRDFHGVQFDATDTAYLRNFVGSRWQLFADGKQVLPRTFRNIWYFDIHDGAVRAYGSTF